AENELQSSQKQNQLYGSARWIEKDSAGPGRFFIRAPLGGVVTASNYRSGESVAPNQVIATVADVSVVAVQGNVFYENLASIHVGERAEVRVSAYPGRTFSAQLRGVADTVDPSTKTVRVLLEAPNPQRQLKIGMPAEIEIETADQSEGILIPEACVLNEEDGSAIYVRVAGNQFVRRAVTTGARVGDKIEIKSGLKAGEEFVSQGPMSIKAESLRGALATGENDEGEGKKE
ncbi:MAG: efflux RND transporter periplasmic adaptor subunit, partial [Acidobacteriia bacterium]|nr:efflux RND transporter periplasmic adaptor subunit [Terriglobia bacterium]